MGRYVHICHWEAGVRAGGVDWIDVNAVGREAGRRTSRGTVENEWMNGNLDSVVSPMSVLFIH